MRATKPLRIDGTVDIECSGWDQYVTGVLYSPATGATIHHDPHDLVSDLEERGGAWWAWSGGRYDALLVAEILRQRQRSVSCSMSGSSASRVVSGRLALYDACLLIPMSLDRAASMIGLRAPRGPGWPCTCGESCGGYCQIRPSMSPERRRVVDDLCVSDATIAYRVLEHIRQVADDAGLVLRSTLGGTAWASARASASLPDASLSPAHWRIARKAYYGGRTSVFRTRARAGHHYDINSAYPAALAEIPVPIGEPAEAAGKRASIAYGRGIPGVYYARVTVPDVYVPPLPARLSTGRIAYPVGRLSSWWTLPELQYAESTGVRIDRVEECLAWPDGAEPVYSSTVSAWYARRLAAGKHTALGDWWRLLPNSLTGKLAEAPDKRMVQICPRSVRYCLPGTARSDRAGCTRSVCTGRCQSYRQLDPDGYIWSVPFWRPSPSAHIHHAGYLTAATRAKWHAAAVQIPEGRLVYGATDSLWVASDSDDELGEPLDVAAPSPIGDGLGQWSFKCRWVDWRCLAPNCYRYVDVSTGESIVRAAGMPGLTDEQWREAEDRDRRIVSDRGVHTLTEAAGRGSLFSRRYSERRLPSVDGWVGDRALDPFEARTYPREHGQIERAKGASKA